jgi:hypothetical protein
MEIAKFFNEDFYLPLYLPLWPCPSPFFRPTTEKFRYYFIVILQYRRLEVTLQRVETVFESIYGKIT